MTTHRTAYSYPLSRRGLLLCCFLLLASSLGLAAGFTLEQVMSSPFPSNLVAAKHKPRIAWVFDARGERNVWVADAPDFAARQVTAYHGDDGQAIGGLQLSPDGKTLVYARGAELNGGGHVANPGSALKEPKQQVWALDLDKSGAHPRLLGDMNCPEEDCANIQISADGKSAVWAGKDALWIAPLAAPSAPDSAKGVAQKLHELQGESSDPRWSPEGRQVAFTLGRKGHSFIAVMDVGADQAARSVRYLSPSVDLDQMPRWSPDGRQLAFVRAEGRENRRPIIPVTPQPWAIWVADAASGSAKEIWHSGTTEESSLPASEEASFDFADGGRILFSSEHSGHNHLYSVSIIGGDTPTLLTPGDFDVEDVMLTEEGQRLLYTSNQFSTDPRDQDRRHIWSVNLNGDGPARPPLQLTRGEGMEWTPVEVQKEIVCLGSTATTAAMPYHVTALGREAVAAQAIPADFPSAELVTPQQVIFKSAGGYTIHGQIFVPRDRNRLGSAPGPALIFTHGGPSRQMMLGFHYMYYYHNAYAENQYLASRGYVVLSVNYRLGVMYGRAFRRAPNSGWRGAAEYNDVLAGAKYLQSLPIVDKKRIGLWGGSYGGYLTALGLARNSDIFAAGVDFHGVHDWSVFLPRWENLATAAPDAREANKLAYESSPVASIATWKSPVLLIHGDDDRNVGFNQTEDLAQRLRHQKVPFEQLIFPDDIHDFLLWKNWVHAYKATGEFFDRNLK